ncbi:MAG TPA: NAD(P)H-hydrate dehydratase [Flavobacterium sp.]|jgi:hydroxyethylthiazole kinase-like uncharacterized protein yjeF
MLQHIHITKTEILKRYQPIDKAAHKGTQGHALIIGGSYGKMGCVCLASKAALTTGCGLVTAYIPSHGNSIIQTAVPEAMAISDKSDKFISDIKYRILPQAIGIGPGLGLEAATQKALRQFLKLVKVPLVVDADAINIISGNKSWFKLLPPKTILTPHVRELERLAGTWKDEDEKMKKVIAISKLYDVIFVVKGAPTFVVYHDQIYENTSGNPALATAGSGDVLTGMITSLLAQSYQPMDAAVIAVFLHGLTADLAQPETGYQSFIASDIIRYIGKAWLAVSSL